MREGELDPPVRALLLDIEGTTTPISFVFEVLFPYAHRHLEDYLTEHLGSAEIAEVAAALSNEWSAEVAHGESVPVGRPVADDVDSLCQYLKSLMDRDRKSPGLKLIQGKIWERGYQDGKLRSKVFADVPPAFARWTAAGITIAIYSSGSVLAQRLLFTHSESGDLTASIARYYDTSAGPKKSAESYHRIAAALHLAPAEVAFVSDVDAELEAAREAGCRVVMCVRPGNVATTSRVAPTVRSFEAIDDLLCLAPVRP